jgi:GAF domain-containing protein/anti-sigma regulatory factor (Ser/Thr protein kinase)
MGVVTVAGDVLLMVVDCNGVVVQWSDQAEELAGCAADEVVGQPVAHLVTRVAVGARGPARAGRAEVLAPGADGHAIGDLRLQPMPRPDGSVAWAVFQAAWEGATTPDVQAAAVQAWSEAEKLHARLRVGNQLRARIGQTLDVVAVCQEVADALVPGFADVAVVEVVDSVIRGEDLPLAPLGREVPLRRAAFRYGGGEPPVQAHPVGDVRKLPFPGPYAQVLTDLKLRVIDLGSDLPWLSADPERAAAIRASGVRTLVAAPLTLRGAVLGLLSLYRTEQAGSFDEEDVGFVVTLATAAALSIDRARLYTREHTIAAALQRRLLPAQPCAQTGIETARAQVFGHAGGGGWSDSFTVASARTALVVGEVSGQGIQAAAIIGELRTVVRSLARLDLEPDELLARLNDTAILLAAERAALPPSDPSRQDPLTASCVYAIYDPLAQTCTYARAHYPPPVIVSPDGTPAEVPDVPPGPLLGTADGLPFTAASVKVPVGSILACYTRSILPAGPSGDRDDLGPLCRILADAQRPLHDLCDDVVYSLPDRPRPGDAVLVLARTRTFPPGQAGTWQFGPAPQAAGRARAQVRGKLADWNIDEETMQATELIVSELVTNAIRYGGPPMWLRVIKDLTISCEIHDGNPATPRLRHPGTLDEFGRGLLIVGRLVQAWGTRYTPDGKTVWAEVALPPHPQSH